MQVIERPNVSEMARELLKESQTTKGYNRHKFKHGDKDSTR